MPRAEERGRRVLETRRREGMVMRRYELADGMRETTYELPAAVLRRIGMPRIRELIASVERGRQARERVEQVRRHIAQNLDVKPTALAAELGMNEGWVRQIRKSLLQQADSTKGKP